MIRLIGNFSPRTVLALVLSGATVTAAGAATFKRYVVTQTTGSGGATDFLQTTASSSGLQGEVGASPDTGYPTPFGVFGVYDPSGTTFGIGVLGASTTGYGIAGESLSNTQPSILAYPGGNGIGLQATTLATSSSPAVDAESKGYGYGVLGRSGQTGTGVFGTSALGSGVEGISEPSTGGIGVVGSQTGVGVLAVGYSGKTIPAIRIEQGVANTDLLGAYNSTGRETTIIQAGSANRSGGALTGGSDVQISGDVYVYGKIYQNCGAFPATSGTFCNDVTASTAFTTNAVGRSPQERRAHIAADARSIDRMGEARMTNGRAYVRFDPDFAASISHAKPYMVVVTPKGDSRGVFVVNDTPAGFEVRENGGGRSTLAFDYRVVATPVDDAVGVLAANARKTGFTDPPDATVLKQRARLEADRARAAHTPAIEAPSMRALVAHTR